MNSLMLLFVLFSLSLAVGGSTEVSNGQDNVLIAFLAFISHFSFNLLCNIVYQMFSSVLFFCHSLRNSCGSDRVFSVSTNWKRKRVSQIHSLFITSEYCRKYKPKLHLSQFFIYIFSQSITINVVCVSDVIKRCTILY